MVDLSNHTAILSPVLITMVSVTSNNENPSVGDDITLTCTIKLDSAVDTAVMVTARWSGPEGALSDTTTTDLESAGTYKSTLTLTSLEITDSGDYTCTATANSVDVFVTTSDPVSNKLVIKNFGNGSVDIQQICN